MFFGGLAEQYSVEPVSASNQVRCLQLDAWGPAAHKKEAFGLKAGELSGIISTGGKYLVLRAKATPSRMFRIQRWFKLSY